MANFERITAKILKLGNKRFSESLTELEFDVNLGVNNPRITVPVSQGFIRTNCDWTFEDNATVEENFNVGGALDVTGNTVMDGALDVTGNSIFRGNLEIAGSLVYLNIQNLQIEDKNIELNFGSTTAAAEGAGFDVKGTSNASLATLKYDSTLRGGGSKFKIGAAASEKEILVAGEVVNADIKAGAAIAGSKIDPTFGNQQVSSTTQGNRFGSAAGSSSLPTTANTNVIFYNNGVSSWAGMGVDTGGVVYLVAGTSGTPSVRMFWNIEGQIGFGSPTNLVSSMNSTGLWNLGTGVSSVGLTTGTHYLTSSNTSPFIVNRSTGTSVYQQFGIAGLVYGHLGATTTKIFSLLDGSGNERMFMLANGTVSIGTAAGGSSVHEINGGGLAVRSQSGGGNLILSATASNFAAIVGTTASAPNLFYDTASGQFLRQTSSGRYKKDVKPLGDSLKKVMALKPVTFKSKLKNSRGPNRYLGFLAEDVEKVDRKLVEFDKGQAEGVHYALIPVLLTKALQEQQELILSLTARLKALESR